MEGTILQLANCYLLLAMCSTAVLRTTNEKSVVKNFLTAMLLGDIGHLYVLRMKPYLNPTAADKLIDTLRGRPWGLRFSLIPPNGMHWRAETLDSR